MLFPAICVLTFASWSLSLKTGSCPPTLPVSVCYKRCGTTNPCTAPQLCCATSCGGAMCVDPVTQRRFVNLVKPGECPATPGGVWVCSHTCTGDSDCPRKLKCCPNRCGAKVCTRAELPPTALSPNVLGANQDGQPFGHYTGPEMSNGRPDMLMSRPDISNSRTDMLNSRIDMPSGGTDMSNNGPEMSTSGPDMSHNRPDMSISRPEMSTSNTEVLNDAVANRHHQPGEPMDGESERT